MPAARSVGERAGAPEAVLWDRDGTLVHDVPYNGDPDAVVPVAGARAALERLRRAGCRLALVTNQSGIGRGLLTHAQVEAVNRRVDELLGPFDEILLCPHAEHAGCACRKPRPGLVHEALRQLGVAPSAAVLVGDIGSDLGAARAAGVRGILVPTAATRAEEVRDAAEVAASLAEAVDRLLGPPGSPAPPAPPADPAPPAPSGGRGGGRPAGGRPAGERPGGGRR